jgi:hypothetical protein
MNAASPRDDERPPFGPSSTKDGNEWFRLDPPSASGAMALDIVISDSLNSLWGQPRPTLSPFLWRGRIELPIEVVPTIADAMIRRAGAAYDEAIRNAIRVEVVSTIVSRPDFNAKRGFTAVETTFVTIVLDRSIDLRLQDIAFGFRVTFRVEDKIIETVELERSSFSPAALSIAKTISEITVESKAPVLRQLATRNDWSVELRGDPTQALCDFDRSEYWNGIITLEPNEVWIDGRDAPELRLGSRTVK